MIALVIFSGQLLQEWIVDSRVVVTVMHRLQRVSQFFIERPKTANATTGIVAGLIGDSIAQHVERVHTQKPLHEHRHDWRRTASVSTYMAMSGVFLYLPFYAWLDRTFGASGTHIKAVAAKVVLDDFIFVPAVEIPTYMAWTSTAEGDDVMARFQEHFTGAALAAWAFNVPVSLLNFTLVPPHLRIVFLDVAELAWSSILSYVTHDKVQSNNDEVQTT